MTERRLRKPMRKKMWTVSQVARRGSRSNVRLEGPLDLGHCGHAADGGHVTFVEVAEGWGAVGAARSAAIILAAAFPIGMAGWATPGT